MSARGFVTTAVSALRQGKVTEHERSILTHAVLTSDPDVAELLRLIDAGYSEEAAQKARVMAVRRADD